MKGWAYMKKIAALLLSAVMVLLAACGTGVTETTADTAEITTKPEQSTEQTTEAVTEAEPDPEETLVAGEYAFEDGFSFCEIPTERRTISKGEKNVSVDGRDMTVTYESRFFGASSMIDRDSHHMGDIFVSGKYSTVYPADDGYVFGEFTGDRFSEYLYYSDGVLYMYEGGGNKVKYNEESFMFSQKIDADARLRGTGDFDGDGYTDILLVGRYRTAFIGYGSEDGFEFRTAGRLDGGIKYENDEFYTGDINGDRRCDIIAVRGADVCSWIINEDGQAQPYAEKRLNVEDAFECCCVADLNTDDVCDLVVYLGDKKIRTYFGHTDGQFGPHEDEVGNYNLYPTWDGDVVVKYMTPADMNEDGVDDIVGTMKRKAATDFCLVSLNYPTMAPAYDYSTNILKKDDGTYLLYNGGLYVDYNVDKYNPTDGDHVLVYTSDDGIIWHRNLDAPAFYLGGELGKSGEWWTGNTIEPEVVCVDGTYYMYWQCENYTHLEDGTLIGHDKIGVATSKDGLHFERKTDSPVIINEPDYSSFDHEEVMYVKDDPDGLPFWLYVRHVVRNKIAKFVRLRSADPFCFDFGTAEEVLNWNGLGNQTGWCRLDDGSLLYVHMAVVQSGASTAPALQFSDDGLYWSGAYVVLAGPNPNDSLARDNPNLYFAGFSTLNGTGEIERTEDGGYRLVYGGCTAKTPVAPEIFYSSVGGGECTFRIEVSE